MSKPFSTLIKKMPAESRERIRKKTIALKKEMALADLRQARKLTQAQLAKNMKVNQVAISKFEHQSDLYLSTLRKFLAGMGAELKVVAKFPEAEITINQFSSSKSVKQKAVKTAKVKTKKVLRPQTTKKAKVGFKAAQGPRKRPLEQKKAHG